MGESLTTQRRVCEEGPRVVKHFEQGRKLIYLIPGKFDGTCRTSSSKFVPAAAVIRMEQALFGFTGRKGDLGGLLSLL